MELTDKCSTFQCNDNSMLSGLTKNGQIVNMCYKCLLKAIGLIAIPKLGTTTDTEPTTKPNIAPTTPVFTSEIRKCASKASGAKCGKEFNTKYSKQIACEDCIAIYKANQNK